MIKTLPQILGTQWAIAPKGELMLQALMRDGEKARKFYQDEEKSPYQKYMWEEDGILFLKYSSVMTKDTISFWGILFSLGTEAIANTLRERFSTGKYRGLILLLDTPGGQVDGTANLAGVMKTLDVPTAAVIDNGMIASAGYWWASSADKIFASSPTDQVGSIGTMMAWADFKPAYEKEGVKFHSVYASKSVDKNREITEAEKENYEPLISALDETNEIFLDAVRENRPAILEQAFSGKLYIAKEAIQKNLIDGMGGVEAALEYINGMSNSEGRNTHTQIKTEMDEKKTFWERVFSKMNAHEKAPSEETAQAVADELQALQKELTEAKAKAANFEAEKVLLEASLQAEKTKYEALETKFAVLEAKAKADAEKLKELEDEPVPPPSVVQTDGTSDSVDLVAQFREKEKATIAKTSEKA